MQIRMLKTADGSVNGIRVQSYTEGEQYDLGTTAGARELAESFVGSGLAEEVGAEKPAPAGAELVTDDAAGESPAAPAKAGRGAKSK